MSRPLCYMTVGCEADVEQVDAIERQSFSRPWTAEQIREVLGAGRVAVLRQTDSRVSAYCVFHRVADELQIQTVAVAPALRRHGLGRALLGWLLDAASRDGLQVAVLEVRASNNQARNLYETLGFRELAQRPLESLEGAASALVMSRELGGP